MWTFKTVIVLTVITWINTLSDYEDCTVKEHLPCRLYKRNSNDCAPSALQSYLPQLYNDTMEFPGEAATFDGIPFYKRYTTSSGDDKGLRPGVNLTFTPKPDVSMKFIKGFEIMRYREGTALPACYIFDLSNASWNLATDMNTTLFHLMLHPLVIGKKHVFELYMLPKPPPYLDQYKSVVTTIPKAIGIVARDWQASIIWKMLEKQRQIKMNFSSPPVEFGFQAITVYLFEFDEEKIFEEVNVNVQEPWYNFNNVTPGNYQIWVQPYDPSQNTDTCKCQQGVCIPCSTTKTSKFTFFYEPSTTTTSTTTTTPTTTSAIKITSTEGPEEGNEMKYAIAFSVLALVLLITIGVVAFFYYRRCKTKDIHGAPEMDNLQHGGDINDNFDKQNPGYNYDGSITTVEALMDGKMNINNRNANKMLVPQKPKVFLLYEEDHEYHRRVVDNFAKYLQQHCQCNVMYAEWHLDSPWVHQELEQADFTVIINSEGAYQSYTEDNSKREYDRQYHGSPKVSSINSIRNKFYNDERYDNIVMVYFDYTGEKFVLPDVCPGYKYKLMKHFPDFLLHIHKLRRTDNLAQYDLPFDCNHRQRPVGQQLLDSVADVVKFERENPKWAFKKFGLFRSCSHVSDDSQLDSGLPEDLNSPGQTPNTETSDPWSIDRKLHDYLCSRNLDVVTINPSDFNIRMSQTNVPVGHRAPLKLSCQSFENQYQNAPNHHCSPITGGSEESNFSFLPPDEDSENFDAASKTQSEQMKSIVNRYYANSNPTPGLQNGGHSEQGQNSTEVDPGVGYDKNVDLDLLKRAEIMSRFSGIDEDEISLGGESV